MSKLTSYVLEIFVLLFSEYINSKIEVYPTRQRVRYPILTYLAYLEPGGNANMRVPLGLCVVNAFGSGATILLLVLCPTPAGPGGIL